MNKSYPAGTEFFVTMKVESLFTWNDEADVIEELFWWQKKVGGDSDMRIVPGSVRAELNKATKCGCGHEMEIHKRIVNRYLSEGCTVFGCDCYDFAPTVDWNQLAD